MKDAEKNLIYYVWITVLLGLLVFWAFAMGGIWALISLLS